MLTKGIDLPQVTLVGIIAADGLLYMNDYWASGASPANADFRWQAGPGGAPNRAR